MTRLDKWLWAARFFRTRAKAKQAIEGGKIHMGGVRSKPSKELKVGDEIVIRQGFDEKTVSVLALSEQRRGAPEASLLYMESESSIARRAEATSQRKVLSTSQSRPDHRPSKKERRQIHRFKDQQE
jgi:ribosome-associated heat shock protein Hsp15